MRKSIGLVILTTFILMSCSDKSDRVHPSLKELGHSASKVSVTSSELLNSGEWSGLSDFKNSNLISFQSCLKDPLLNPLYQAPLNIKSPLRTHKVVTDANGCFQWNELFEFNPLSEEQFFDYKIEINEQRQEITLLEIPLMVNPWKSSSNLRDLRYDNQPIKVSKSQDLEHNPLKVINFSYSQTMRANMVDGVLKMPSKVEFKLVYEKFDEYNELKEIPIKNGKVNVQIRIIENDGVLIAKKTEEITAINGLFTKNFDFNIVNMISGRGPYRVDLNIKFPIKEINEINVSIPIDSIEGGAAQIAQPTRKEEIESEITESIIEEERIDSNSPTGFIVSKINAIPGQIAPNSYNKTSIRNQKSRLTICLNDSLSGNFSRPLINFPFKLSSSFGKIEEETFKTKENGCAEVNLSFDYDLFSCEKFIPIELRIEGIGQWSNQIVSRKVEINPWNTQDYFYDNQLAGKAPNIACLKPKYSVSNVEYENQGLLRDQLKANKFLELNFKRRYKMRFNPMLNRVLSTNNEQKPTSINFGKLKVLASLYAPTTEEINYLRPEGHKLMLLSQAESEFHVNEKGEANGLLDFSFMIADAHLLSHKNIIVLSVESDEFSGIEKSYFAFNFIASANSSSNVVNLSKDELVSFEKELKDETELAQTPESIYLEHLKEINKDKEVYSSSNLEGINAQRPLGNGQWQLGSQLNKSRYYSELTFEEMRMLSRENGKMPNDTLKKLCRHFYSIPQIKREARALGGINYIADGGAQFLKCIEEPRKHISILGITFINKLLGTDKNNFQKVKFISDNKGRLNRGKGYFAGSGDRSSIDFSTSQTSSWMVALGGEFGLPAPFNFGMEGGYAKTYAISDSKSTGNSQMAMTRYGSNQDDLNLNFESLTLELMAETKECFSASAINAKRVLLLCMPENRLQKIQENWYFIEESQSTQNGIIADGIRPGNDYLSQVVRGKENFNRLWDKFVHNDSAMIVQNLDQLDIYEAFRPILKDSPAEFLFQKSKDNAIPGAIIKTVRNPHSNNVGISR